MKQDVNNKKHFIADENKTFVQKETGLRFGFDLYLSSEDTIEAYQEDNMTEEESKKKTETVEKGKH